VSIEKSLGLVTVDASNRDAAEAEAVAIAQSLTESLPIGATMQSVVWVSVPYGNDQDQRHIHRGMTAAMWALVDTDGRPLVAMRPDWPADTGLAPFSTVDESMAVLLASAG
jgi:hypothetical protein